MAQLEKTRRSYEGTKTPKSSTSPTFEQLLKGEAAHSGFASPSTTFHEEYMNPGTQDKKSVLAKVKERAKKLKYTLSSGRMKQENSDHSSDSNNTPPWGITLEVESSDDDYHEKDNDPEYLGAPMYESETAPENLKETARQHPRACPVVSENHLFPNRMKHVGTAKLVIPNTTMKHGEVGEPVSPNTTIKHEESAKTVAPNMSMKHEEARKPQDPNTTVKQEEAEKPVSQNTTMKHEKVGKLVSPNTTMKHEESVKPVAIMKHEEVGKPVNPNTTMILEDAGKPSSPNTTMKNKEIEKPLGLNTTMKHEEIGEPFTSNMIMKHEEIGKPVSPNTTMNEGNEKSISSPRNTTMKNEENEKSITSPRNATMKNEENEKSMSLRNMSMKNEENEKSISPNTTRTEAVTGKLGSAYASKFAQDQPHKITTTNQTQSTQHETTSTNNNIIDATDDQIGRSPGAKNSESKNNSPQKWDKGVSVKEYFKNKLEPGEDERALSRAITEAISPRRSPTGRDSGGVVGKVKGAVTSFFRHDHQDQPSNNSSNPNSPSSIRSPTNYRPRFSKVFHPTANVSSSPPIPISTNAHEVYEDENQRKILQAN